ncbi:MAG: zinc ribbon domain-containing protein, partial [Betaproteobacteria bacterium]|nr:zinc ribbon domain-containing protein [Betaproteobacteria bacterium]
LTECPACHKPDLRKLVSAAGFQLKGSGWYVTDFRNSGGKPAAKTAGAKPADAAASAAASSADAGSSGKTESTSGDGKSTEPKPSVGATATTTKAPGTTPGGNGGS